MAGFGVLIKFGFHYLHLSCGTGRNWSVLAFRFASLPSPPIPATAQALTWAATFGTDRHNLTALDFGLFGGFELRLVIFDLLPADKA